MMSTPLIVSEICLGCTDHNSYSERGKQTHSGYSIRQKRLHSDLARGNQDADKFTVALASGNVVAALACTS